MRLCQLTRVWSQQIRIERCFHKLETFDIICNLPLSSIKSSGCVISIPIIFSSAMNRTRQIQWMMRVRQKLIYQMTLLMKLRFLRIAENLRDVAQYFLRRIHGTHLPMKKNLHLPSDLSILEFQSPELMNTLT